jgi:maltooligosyltrehalose synthase
VDHPDGMHDPKKYFDDLQRAVSKIWGSNEEKAIYLLVEKILEHGESLR